MSKNQDLGELINGIKSLGTNQLNAPAYTSASSFTGTLAGLLGFDSSGNVISLASTSLTLNAGQISAAIGYNPVPDNRTLTINGVTYDLTANRSWSVSGSSQWTTSGSNIYFTGGFVGINNTNPLYSLDVLGAARFNAWSTMGVNARFAWNMISNQYLNDGYAGAIVVDNADGRFSFYTAPLGVAGAFPVQTERVSITNAGRVGIGTTSIPYKLTVLSTPSASGFDGLVVTTGSADVVGLYRTGSSYGYGMVGANQSWIYSGFGDLNILTDASSTNIKFGTSGGVERMRITSAGNVGIGTIAPLAITNGATLHINGNSSAFLTMGYGSTRYLTMLATSGYAAISTTGNVPLVFEHNETEFMRIMKGFGVTTTLAIGTTTPYRASSRINILHGGASLSNGITSQTLDSSGYHMEFVTSAGYIVGTIVTNSSNTFYSTSSDYRLKYDYQEIKALELIHKLKMYQFKWKIDNSLSYGVQAHELQEFVPNSVVGEKDGKEMQSVDYSKLAPIAIAGVQQLHKLFESHAEKIARLEAEVSILKQNNA